MKIKIMAVIFLLSCSMIMEAAKKPLIGITCDGHPGASVVDNTYSNAIAQAGGIPVLIPLIRWDQGLEALVSKLDGIIFTGGEDCDPSLYGESPIPQLGDVNDWRDTVEIKIAKMFMKTKKPILAICRGEQLINVVCGGSLYQDLPSQTGHIHSQPPPGNIPFHEIEIEKGSILNKILGVEKVAVNSMHHEAVKQIGDGLKVIATASDGVVEAYQSTGKRQTILGMQFHPEALLETDSKWLPIFEWFVEEAK